MTVKERFITALQGKIPDRLPVTTHHLLPYFLNKYMNGMSSYDFFIKFGIDPIVWVAPHLADKDKGYFYAGGGIVVDSDAKAEYQETLDKAAALIESVTT